MVALDVSAEEEFVAPGVGSSRREELSFWLAEDADEGCGEAYENEEHGDDEGESMHSGSLLFDTVGVHDDNLRHADSGDHGGEEEEREDDDCGQAHFRDELVLAEILS